MASEDAVVREEAQLDEVDEELLREVERLRKLDAQRVGEKSGRGLLLSEGGDFGAFDSQDLDGNGRNQEEEQEQENSLQPGQEYYTGGLLPNGVRHGKGTLVYENRYFRYAGEWSNGIKNGQGTLFFGDSGADFYEGQFLDGEITGRGIRQWEDGSSYNGEWVWGERCGEGVLLSADGTKYEGSFRANQRHGTGTLTRHNGDVYMGDFRANRQHGHGTLECVNGDTYDGDFQNGLFHGIGEAVWANGDTYAGQWAEGKRHGKGVFVDGVSLLRYEGEWTLDAPNRVPTRIHPNLPQPEPESASPEEGADAQVQEDAKEGEEEEGDEEEEESEQDDDTPDEASPMVLQAVRGQPWVELLQVGVVAARPRNVTSKNLTKAVVSEESGRILELVVVDTQEESKEEGEDSDVDAKKPRVLCRMQTENGRAAIDPSVVVPEGEDQETVFVPGASVLTRLQDATQGLRPEERVRPAYLQVVLPKK